MNATRRGFLHVVVSATVSGALFTFFQVRRTEALPRPPGAIREDDFLGYCSRCFRCIDVCQPMALRPASIFDGIANLGTPVLDVGKCIICMECIRTCPTGALRKVPKDEVDLGTAVIDQDRCLAWQKKKRCKYCYKACPPKAIDLMRNRFPVLKPEKCNGCGICVRQCPTEPKSITISSEGSKRFDPSEQRFVLRLEDRVGPYEFPPPDFKAWFVNRVKTLAEHYGIVQRKRR